MNKFAAILIVLTLCAYIGAAQTDPVPENDFEYCQFALRYLTIDTVSQECVIDYDDGEDDYIHKYTLDFGDDFQLDAGVTEGDCFNYVLTSGTDMGNTPVDIPIFDVDYVTNTISFEFSYTEAKDRNCHVTDGEVEYKQACFFQLDINIDKKYVETDGNDTTQQEIQWHSLTTWQKQGTKTVEVDIIKDLVQGCCPPNPLNITDELRFCASEADCDSNTFIAEGLQKFVRNQSFWMKYRITKEGFNKRLLAKNALTFNDYDPVIENPDDLTDIEREPGELTFKLKYAVAATDITVKLVVDIVYEWPEGRVNPIGDQEFNTDGQQAGINDGDNMGTSDKDEDHDIDGSRRRRLQEATPTNMDELGEDYPIGKMTDIEIVDEDDNQNIVTPIQESDDSSVLIAVVIVIGVIIALLIVGGGVFMMNKNKKQENSQKKYEQTAQKTEQV